MSRIITILTVAMIASFAIMATDLSHYIPSAPPVYKGYNDIDSIKAVIRTRPLSQIEGLWLIADNQTTVVVEPAATPQINQPNYNAFQVVLISSARKAIRPGTVLGYIAPAGQPGKYNAYFYAHGKQKILSKLEQFQLTMPDDSHIGMTSSKPKWRVSLRHTFKLLFRATISNTNDDQRVTDGFIKLYPAPAGRPVEPIYL